MNEYITIMPYKDPKKNAEHVKKWRLAHREHWNEYFRNYVRKQRIKAMEVIGQGIIKCRICGFDDIRALEIDHINGGGTIERRRNKTTTYSYKWYRMIITGKRSIQDLQILCGNCHNIKSYEKRIL